MPADEYDQEAIEQLRADLAQRPDPIGTLDDTARKEIERGLDVLEADEQAREDDEKEIMAEIDALNAPQESVNQSEAQDGTKALSVEQTQTAARNFHPRVRARKTRFLSVLRQTANIRAACAAAGFSRRTAYRIRDSNPWFAEKWLEALEDFGDLADMKAKQMAVEGIQEPIIAMGQIVGFKTVHSEKLLLRILEKKRPEDWAPARSESNVRVTGSVGDGTAGSGALSEEARKALTDRVRRLSPVLMARHSAGLKGASVAVPAGEK